jgi:2'-5' RNA ligase
MYGYFMRLFIATFFSDSVVDWLVKSGLTISELFPARSLRLTRAENLHLTFQFLGEVHGSQITPISRMLDEVLLDSQAFEFHTGLVGIFPNKFRPRTLWIGLEPALDFEKIASKISKGLEKSLNIEKKRFLPHITLARFNEEHPALGSVDTTKASILPFSMPVHDRIVSAVSLCKSDLTPRGPIYSILSNFDLGNYAKL